MGKGIFSPEMKSYLITQWNCTTIGSCRCRKTNQWVGSGAARTYGDDTRQISAETGGASGCISGRFAIGSSDFFFFSYDDFVYTDPEAYSPLTMPRSRTQRPRSGLRRLSSPRNLHLPFSPLSLLELSSREGVHTQPDATPLRSARAPDSR